MQLLAAIRSKKISPENIFMISILVVNAGNYLYNLILGRLLGPAAFSDAALLITFLLVLSFMAMTFQLVAAKFAILLETESFKGFMAKFYKIASISGVLIGLLLVIFASQLQQFFNTQSATMFVVFGFGIPLYFFVSINRGIYQGQRNFSALGHTYKWEMVSRLVLTILLLLVLEIESSILVAVGILVSFVFGLLPFNANYFSFKTTFQLDKTQSKQIKNFFLLTAFYEFTQIIINNSDIIMVKYYFDSYQAGLYASLALIGRVVYFITWMFVMLLLPSVVQLKKDGKETTTVLLKYVFYVFIIATFIVLSCYFFPTFIVGFLFGEQYLAIAPLLWQYAVATSLFAVANIFAYYYLSLDQYVPVIIAGFFGFLQIAMVVLFHDTLAQVVQVQIVVMLVLMCIQLAFFKYNNSKSN